MADQSDTKFARAEVAAHARFNIGEQEKDALLERVASTVIRDRLVVPKAMTFFPTHKDDGDPAKDSELRLRYGEKEVVKIHHHALGQLASKVELPMAFVNKLRLSKDDWKIGLLAHNLNELYRNTKFAGDAPRFLHRIVNDELRGFLSRRFNRHLASLPMLRAFVEAYEKAMALPVESAASDVRVSLKAFLPTVFEAYPGQYICVGVEWSNSDFGAGRLAITQTIWDPLRGTRAVMDEPISKIHVGSVIEDADIEMSDETMSKEVETQASAINDAVKQYLSEDQVGRMVRAIKVAHEEEIPFSSLRGQWRNILLKKELESVEALLASSDVVDLPPPGKNIKGEPLPTRFWAASVLSHIADRSGDDDRKYTLQREAGKLIMGARDESETR
jgi:hypothetical protein